MKLENLMEENIQSVTRGGARTPDSLDTDEVSEQQNKPLKKQKTFQEIAEEHDGNPKSVIAMIYETKNQIRGNMLGKLPAFMKLARAVIKEEYGGAIDSDTESDRMIARHASKKRGYSVPSGRNAPVNFKQLKKDCDVQEVLQSKHMLYIPNSQGLELQRALGQSDLFIKFQSLIQDEIERAFMGTGLAQHCLDIERQNQLFVALLLEKDLKKKEQEGAKNRAIEQDGKPNMNEIKQQQMLRTSIEQQKSQTKQGYEDLKLSILKRLRDEFSLTRTTENDFLSQGNLVPISKRDQKEPIMQAITKMDTLRKQATSNKDDLSLRKNNKSNSNMTSFPIENALVLEEDLFRAIQKEVQEVVVKSKNHFKKQFEEKQNTLEEINFSLRKGFMRELQLLRETYHFTMNNMLNADGAKAYHKSHIFEFDAGLDQKISELMRMKILEVQNEYINTISDQQRKIEGFQSIINKYKQLTPKTFKLVELSLEEIFQSLAKINQDAFKIFGTLEASYPKDFFIGAIEEKFGAFFDNETEIKLRDKIDKCRAIFENDVKDILERHREDKKEVEEVFKTKSVLIEDLNRQHAQDIRELEKNNKKIVAQAIEEERLKNQEKQDGMIVELEYELQSAKRKIKRFEDIHLENEAKSFFFRWKILTHVLKQNKRADVRKLFQALVSEDHMKLMNSLEANQAEMENYKQLYYDFQEQTIDARSDLRKANMQLMKLRLDYDILRQTKGNQVEKMIETLLPKARQMEEEIKHLNVQLATALDLGLKSQEQRTLIEEKFNLKLNKDTRDPKLRVLKRLCLEYDITTAAARMIIAKHDAAVRRGEKVTFIADPGVVKHLSPHTDDFSVPRGSVTSGHTAEYRNMKTQTDLLNINHHLTISMRGENSLDPNMITVNDCEETQHISKIKLNMRNNETQTSATYKHWQDLQYAVTFYNKVLEDDRFDEIRVEASMNIPEKLQQLKHKDGEEFINMLKSANRSRESNNISRKEKGRKSPLKSQKTLRQKDSASALKRVEEDSVSLTSNSKDALLRSKDGRKNKELTNATQSRKMSPFSNELSSRRNSNQKNQRMQFNLGQGRIIESRHLFEEEERDRSTGEKPQNLQARYQHASTSKKLQNEIIDQANMMQQSSRHEPVEFDRLKFIFELHIDMLEHIKNNYADVYRGAIQHLKHIQIQKVNKRSKSNQDLPLEELQNEDVQNGNFQQQDNDIDGLLKNTAQQLKKLYPKPSQLSGDVYERLKKSYDTKVEQNMEMLREKESLKWREQFLGISQSQAKNLHQLQQNLYRVMRTKGKQNRSAQRQLLKFLELSQKPLPSKSNSPVTKIIRLHIEQPSTVVSPQVFKDTLPVKSDERKPVRITTSKQRRPEQPNEKQGLVLGQTMKLGDRKDKDQTAHLTQSKDQHNYKLDTSQDKWYGMNAPQVNVNIVQTNYVSVDRPAFQNELLLESTKKAQQSKQHIFSMPIKGVQVPQHAKHQLPAHFDSTSFHSRHLHRETHKKKTSQINLDLMLSSSQSPPMAETLDPNRAPTIPAESSIASAAAKDRNNESFAKQQKKYPNLEQIFDVGSNEQEIVRSIDPVDHDYPPRQDQLDAIIHQGYQKAEQVSQRKRVNHCFKAQNSHRSHSPEQLVETGSGVLTSQLKNAIYVQNDDSLVEQQTPGTAVKRKDMLIDKRSSFAGRVSPARRAIIRSPLAQPRVSSNTRSPLLEEQSRAVFMNKHDFESGISGGVAIVSQTRRIRQNMMNGAGSQRVAQRARQCSQRDIIPERMISFVNEGNITHEEPRELQSNQSDLSKGAISSNKMHLITPLPDSSVNQQEATTEVATALNQFGGVSPEVLLADLNKTAGAVEEHNMNLTAEEPRQGNSISPRRERPDKPKVRKTRLVTGRRAPPKPVVLDGSSSHFSSNLGFNNKQLNRMRPMTSKHQSQGRSHFTFQSMRRPDDSINISYRGLAVQNGCLIPASEQTTDAFMQQPNIEKKVTKMSFVLTDSNNPMNIRTSAQDTNFEFFGGATLVETSRAVPDPAQAFNNNNKKIGMNEPMPITSQRKNEQANSDVFLSNALNTRRTNDARSSGTMTTKHGRKLTMRHHFKSRDLSRVQSTRNGDKSSRSFLNKHNRTSRDYLNKRPNLNALIGIQNMQLLSSSLTGEQLDNQSSFGNIFSQRLMIQNNNDVAASMPGLQFASGVSSRVNIASSFDADFQTHKLMTTPMVQITNRGDELQSKAILQQAGMSYTEQNTQLKMLSPKSGRVSEASASGTLTVSGNDKDLLSNREARNSQRKLQMLIVSANDPQGNNQAQAKRVRGNSAVYHKIESGAEVL